MERSMRRRDHAAAGYTPSSSDEGGPCEACKFLQRRCMSGCVFAPHFRTEQGTTRFAAVHKVFEASNVSKLLHRVSVPHQGDAAETICFEAQARLSEPIYDCVPTIIALQQQMHLLSSMVATDNIPRCSQQQQQQQHIMPSPPAYSTNSPASGAFPLLGSSCFPSGLCFAVPLSTVMPFPRSLGAWIGGTTEIRRRSGLPPRRL
ncbi:hypothetical protein Taro_035743 [Colocasia esculenta]|uniref:LOB domain-containing protein n=1 Tax=Colocasia esculenta TaxID=4460 RepID=A0A843VVD2_COLES|nr:hypothetical protein [Colocasia esculenta]